MLNVELLQETMQHLTDHPEQHNQGIVVDCCGTAACFAGRSALLSGWSVSKIASADIYQYAQLLGLTKAQARTLFWFDNTRPMLELMVKDLVNDDVLRAPDAYRMQANGEDQRKA